MTFLSDLIFVQEFSRTYALMRNSFKFMFVRQPYKRLYSAYLDKLLGINTEYWRFANENILPLVRNTNSSCGHDVSFPEFVKYIIRSETIGENQERHFTTMTSHCHPCQMDYDFIGKIETFNEDINMLISTWNKKFNGHLIKDNNKNVPASSLLVRAVTHLMRTIEFRTEIEGCMPIYNAFKRGWRDLQLRGFIPISEAIPVTAEQVNIPDYGDLTEELRTYVQKALDKKIDLSQQKRDAFVEAYSLISDEDLNELRSVLLNDCNLFEYDCSPADIFVQSRQIREAKTELKYLYAV